MAFDEQAAIDRFWEARRSGDYFPTDWYDRLTVDQAFRIQLGVAARREAMGERRVGWKIGLTSDAAQRQFGLREPVFGYLVDGGLTRSGHVFGRDELISPAFEVEVCVRLCEPLSGTVDAARARRAVDLCHPALEVVEIRGDLVAQFALAMADNAQQKAFVLGEPVPLGDIDLRGVETRVAVNGEGVARGHGEAVGGDPLNSVIWLARKLGEYGLSLRAGDLIMTGSFTRQFPLAPGDHVRAEFDGLGTVEVGVAA